jgi:YNFM family putative membrane transporter
MAVTTSIVIVGVLITLMRPLWAMVAGVAMVTFGFFGTHAVASAWVGSLGGRSKGHASALYLFCFYAGLSVLGSAGGLCWDGFRWPGIVAMASVLAVSTLVITVVLGRGGR